MKCLQCARADLQAKPQFTKLGMAACPLDPTGTFVSLTFERSCKKFNPAPAEVVAKRETWAKKL